MFFTHMYFRSLSFKPCEAHHKLLPSYFTPMSSLCTINCFMSKWVTFFLDQCDVGKSEMLKIIQDMKQIIISSWK